MPTNFHLPFELSLAPQRSSVSFAGAPPKGAHSRVRALPPYVMIPTNLPRFLIPFILFMLLDVTFSSASKSNSQCLLKFKESLRNNGALSDWNAPKPPCQGENPNWTGVLCNNGTVWGLKLEKMGLEGTIDVESLKEMPDLRTISIMNNNFMGPLPNLNVMGALKTIYLSSNKFSGEIPANAFEGMQSLKKLHLAHNQFSGPIPKTLTELPRLIELMMEDNKFAGEIPEFRQERLQVLNLSNNNLEGPIPPTLNKMTKSSFAGNSELCGEPLDSCSSASKLSVGTIVVIIVVVVAALVAITVAIIILRTRRGRTTQTEDIPTSGAAVVVHAHKKMGSADLDRMEQGCDSPKSTKSSAGKDTGKLSFLRDDRERFDLSDLLRASAEILGSGVFGSTYKAAINGGHVMVVKRFKKMNNVGKEEFQEHMRRLGRLRHPNLLPLVAFYYRKEEKLLVSDYVANVSLAVHLHGSRSRGQPSPDWRIRLKIVKGVAKGLLYLYNELPSLIAPHGHLKSSNVLLNESYEPLLTDYGLAPVVNQEHAQDLMIAYKAPEYKQNRRITKKTDVWSLGILILEILTGKFPATCLQQGKVSDADLATWVESIIKEEQWMVEVFDKEMGGTKNCEGEMVKLLKIGLSCCEADVEKRWDMKEMVEKIGEVKEKDGDDEFYSSYTSEGDMRSSRGLSEDFSYPTNI